VGTRNRDANHTGQIGISWLRWIVEGTWGCGVEIISSHNDDSLDALILLKRRRRSSAYRGPTGDVIFAQVKTGYISKVPSGPYKISLGEKYILNHRARWLSFPGPVIMINVIPPHITKGAPLVYWSDLRDSESYVGKTQIRFDTQRDLASERGKASLFNLCWNWAKFRTLPIIYAPTNVSWSTHIPTTSFESKLNFHARCRTFYRDWMNEARANPSRFHSVQVSNRGWRHMTRIGRSKSRMLQSMLLLPTASRMLEQMHEIEPQKLSRAVNRQLLNGRHQERYFEGVTARVIFAQRQEAIVQVVLERKITRSNSAIHDERTLYSVYEVARRRGIV
jgi:hypothetical protein